MLSSTVPAASLRPVLPLSRGVASVSRTALAAPASSLRVFGPYARFANARITMSETALSGGSPAAEGWSSATRRSISEPEMSGAAEGARSTRRSMSSAGKARAGGQSRRPGRCALPMKRDTCSAVTGAEAVPALRSVISATKCAISVSVRASRCSSTLAEEERRALNSASLDRTPSCLHASKAMYGSCAAVLAGVAALPGLYRLALIGSSAVVDGGGGC
mmetsp:Transcript_72664/g.161460  ORF Transcript_72664/g.161460 Transcript_72664/m.161460 type:complete len:219 (+) Transcript_72664:413-1069(+)